MSSPSGVLVSPRIAFIPPGRNSELGRGPPNPLDTARFWPGPKLGRGEADSRPPRATLDEACRGCEPKDGEVMPRPENPLGAPVDAVGGPRDCRVSLAGLVGLTGVVDGDGPGDGDRWGRRVCEAMMRSMGDVDDDQPRDRSCTWGQRQREKARGCAECAVWAEWAVMGWAGAWEYGASGSDATHRPMD